MGIPTTGARALRANALSVLLACAGGLTAQAPDSLAEGGITIACPASLGDTSTALPAPALFASGGAARLSVFDVRFADGVPAAARASLEFAAEVWGAYLGSDVPIVVEVDWRERDDARVLASAGPNTLFRDFPGGLPGVFYPVALAEAIAGQDLNEPGTPDIGIAVNAAADWYFGVDGAVPPGQTDLATVALHELGHGLGFISSADTLGGFELRLGFGGRFVVFDDFVETADGGAIGNPGLFANPSADLLRAVTNDDLVFAGETALDRNAATPVPLFAPREFDNGSSVSHLDESAYPAGTPNSLMTPFLARGESVLEPGAVELGVLADLGWDVRFGLASPTYDPDAERAGGLVVLGNPTGGTLRIVARDGTVGGGAVILDAAGRVALVTTLRRLAAGIDIGYLPPGLYTAQAVGGAAVRFVHTPL